MRWRACYGIDPARMLEAPNARGAARALRAASSRRCSTSRFVRWLTRPARRRSTGSAFRRRNIDALAGDAERHRRGAARAARAARLRLPHRRQLFRLAGVRPRATRRGRTPSLPPYLQREQFRGRARAAPTGSRYVQRSFTDISARQPRRERRPLCPARRAGLDERRRADRAVDARSPAPRGRARASSSAPPPTSGCCRAACPTAILGALGLRGGASRELGRARPLVDLWRLPPLYA